MADEFPGDWNAILQLAREARDDPQAGQEKTRPFNTFRAKLKDAGLNVSSAVASKAWAVATSPARADPPSRASRAAREPTLADALQLSAALDAETEQFHIGDEEEEEEEEEELIPAEAGPGAGTLSRIDQHGFDNFQYGLAELQSTFLKPIAEEETLSEFEERLGQGTEAANVPGEEEEVQIVCRSLLAHAVFSKSMQGRLIAGVETIVRAIRRRDDESPETVWCRYFAGCHYLVDRGVALDVRMRAKGRRFSVLAG